MQLSAPHPNFQHPAANWQFTFRPVFVRNQRYLKQQLFRRRSSCFSAYHRITHSRIYHVKVVETWIKGRCRTSQLRGISYSIVPRSLSWHGTFFFAKGTRFQKPIWNRGKMWTHSYVTLHTRVVLEGIRWLYYISSKPEYPQCTLQPYKAYKGRGWRTREEWT